MSMEVEGSLVITQVDEDDDAKYQCLAKNVVGTRGSEKAQLSVLGNDSFIFYDYQMAINQWKVEVTIFSIKFMNGFTWKLKSFTSFFH